MNRIDEIKKKNDNVSLEIMKTTQKIDTFIRRLHNINQLYADIDILETCFERSPQLVIQTVLFIIANYYSRVLYLFDELLFIPITYVFILNWISTILAIANSILRYRNAKRFPMLSTTAGTVLQKLALSVLISGKIVFISAAVANMPYLHPLGILAEILLAFFIHLAVARCRPTRIGKNLLYSTVGIATTSAFYRLPENPSKSLMKKVLKKSDADINTIFPEIKTDNANF